MNCKICTAKTKLIFSAKIMNKYLINYFHCKNCGFLSTETPYWLDEVYANTGSKFDTGCIARNIYLSKQATAILSVFFNRNGQFLDYAAGYGIFVRIMRDIGFDFYWHDKYAQNLFSSGFEWNDNVIKNIEAVTTFESFEHFAEPTQEIEKLLSISNNIIFTTELLPASIPKPNEWWYYSLERGGHVSFYSDKTFRYIASKYHLQYAHMNNFHILSDRKNISDFKLKFLLRLNKLGLDKILSGQLKSKTLADNSFQKKAFLTGNFEEKP